MVDIIIDSNVEELIDKYQSRDENLKSAVEDGLDESAETTVYMMKAEHFPNIDTGKLTSSIEERTTGEFQRTIGPWLDEDYPYYLEMGTRPHVIEGNPYLYWPGADHPVRRVNHPGTRPYPYVAPTAEQMKTEFPRIMSDHVSHAMEE